MKIKSLHLTILIMVILFGSISITSALGLWKTTNDKEPAKYSSGEFAGQSNPSDIRGSYTLNDIFKAFDVPLADLGKAFGVKDPSLYEAFQVKELEALYASLAAEGKEVGTDSVRYFVALYKGLPITVAEETYLSKPAVEILKAKANLSAEQIASIEKHSVILPEITTDAAPPVVTNTPSEGVVPNTIKGNTTFKELLDWGVKKEDIEKVLDDKLPNTAVLIKDYATSKGIEFSTIKEPLQKLVDNK